MSTCPAYPAARRRPTAPGAASRPVRARRGFTLIELLIVVVIIGVLAAIALPRFSSTKGKANLSKVKSDLHNLATAQEGHFFENAIYASSPADLGALASPGVQIDILEATATGWSGRGENIAASPERCYLFYGTAAAPIAGMREGVITCQ